MKNVLFLITTLDTGGAEMQLFNLVKRMKQRGNFRPIVVSMMNSGPVGEMMEKEGITVHSLFIERRGIKLSSIFILLKIINSYKIKLIHAHMYHAIMLGRVMKILKPRLKLISTLHSINIGGRNREIILRMTNGLSNELTIISRLAQEHMIQVKAAHRSKIVTIPNGVDIQLFKQNFDMYHRKRQELGLGNEFVWLAVGRFEGMKNYPNLIQSFKQLTGEYGNARLLLVGQGGLFKEIQEMVSRLGLSENVTFLGLRRDIHEIMNAVDGYVMSSDWEGMPMVLLEASASGLPVVATDVGGIREVVLNEETGFLVGPKDSLALAEHLKKVMEYTAEQRSVMGIKAREYVARHYDLSKIIEMWEQKFQALI